jgi:hypothetical protein
VKGELLASAVDAHASLVLVAALAWMVEVAVVFSSYRGVVCQQEATTISMPLSMLHHAEYLLTYRCNAIITAAFAIHHLILHPLPHLIQKKCALQPHLHDRPIQSHPPNLRFIIRSLDFVQSPLKLDTFAVVCFLDAWRKGGVLSGAFWRQWKVSQEEQWAILISDEGRERTRRR